MTIILFLLATIFMAYLLIKPITNNFNFSKKTSKWIKRGLLVLLILVIVYCIFLLIVLFNLDKQQMDLF